MRLAKLSIRYQLWALFGLLLLTGATVLVIDEVAQYRARQSLLSLQEESLLGVRQLKAVSDGYSLGVIDTTFKARNDLISWEEGVAAVDEARAQIDKSWRSLAQLPRDAEEQALFAQTTEARVRADAAVAQLRAILEKQDIKALGHFADTELFPALDPVAIRLKWLSDRAILRADTVVRADVKRGERVSMLRIGLSVLALLIAALLGRVVLRNAYRGIESLTWLVRRMREHDYTAMPDFQPRGELGTVMDALLETRRDVLGFETNLTAQLALNEKVRGQLELRELFQRALLEAVPTAIIAIDNAGIVTLFNPAAERLLGHSADAYIGKRAPTQGYRGDDLAPSVIDPAFYAHLAAELSAKLGRPVPADWHAVHIAASLGVPPSELEMLHRDGHTIPVLLALARTLDEHGEPSGALGVAVDLTQIKRLEAELRASETRAIDASRTKSEFLAAMSHEIRTPMIGVTGMLEVLEHTQLDHEQRRAINVIQQSAASLLQIIGDILDFSKIEAGRLELAPETVNLARLLQSTVANYHGSASSRGLALRCEIDPRVFDAHVADPLRLRQIVNNFLSNAIKFTEHGTVEAALELRSSGPDGDQLCLRVSDSGIGISAEAQARLFQPFAQAETDTTRRFGGTGLGLAICRRLADLMSGLLTMESSPGHGTTMRLLLQLPRGRIEDVKNRDDAFAPAPSFVPRRLPSLDEAMREHSLILLVDDHSTNRLVIARQLSLAGYACEAAVDGEEGLERWRSGRYALLLSDVHMPKLDGYAMTRAIRNEEAQRNLARTPIVALTAAALKGEAERCLAAGMDDYLAKPVTIPQLVASLHRWLPHTRPGAGADADASAEARDTSAPAHVSEALPQLQAAPPVLDISVLHELSGGGDADTRALLQDFLDSTLQDVAELDSACRDGDKPALTRQAHKIKGAARLVGAGELADAASELEAAGQGEDWSALLPLSADVKTAAERLRLFAAERYPNEPVVAPSPTGRGLG